MIDLFRLRPADVVQQRAELDEVEIKVGEIALRLAADTQRNRGLRPRSD